MEWIVELAREGGLFWTGIVSVVLAGIVLSNLRQMYQVREKQRTIRQITRHVADGELTAEQGAALIAPMSDHDGDIEKQIASAVAWGAIPPDKADRLFQTLRRTASDRAAAPQAARPLDPSRSPDPTSAPEALP